ncbi:hypothetical protein FACS189419_08630 [Planctomycetales bacterium]|nr:hypothetical protein FACS189419_08630 [Planctomycetales bacterium]
MFNKCFGIFVFSVLFQTALFAEKPERLFFSVDKKTQTEEKHFSIRSGISSEKLGSVSEKLETLYYAWTELFLDKNKPVENTKHKIIIFRSKAEYVRSLRQIEPNIAQSNGYYSPQTLTAYFYFNNENFDRTLLHEVTHQLFSEVYSDEKFPRGINFWLVEGTALFMETLKTKTNQCSLGDIMDDWLYAAKEYRYKKNFRLPVSQLVTMTAKDIQHDENIRKIYAQSAALVHWMMFAENGKYRPALQKMLRQVYDETTQDNSLSRLTGLPFDEIDKKYDDFLKTVPD